MRPIAVTRPAMRTSCLLWQASRGHYCVHKTVSKKTNIDEECDALLEDKACKFFNNVHSLFPMQTSHSLQVGNISCP